MKTRLVTIPSIKDPIKPSPGFEKKGLATHKLDIMGLCGFGCSYCSSNEGNYLRINRARFAEMTREQTGQALLPATSPGLSFRWGDFEERLDAQLRPKPRSVRSTENTVTDPIFAAGRWGYGHTLVFSQLTDAFSPWAVADGLTERTLDKVLRRTGFRIRVLTKSAIVGTDKWIKFFDRWSGRFVVGLSIGTLDDAWARCVEVGTSSPTARRRAHRRLQDEGVPTFGMLCPVFPDALDNGGVERLVEAIRPERCETVWSEPYNDRGNWRHVAAGYTDERSRAYIARLFCGSEARREWSWYAGHLYDRVHAALGADAHKHRYLLYQDSLVQSERERLCGAQGVLFQSEEKPPRRVPLAEMP